MATVYWSLALDNFIDNQGVLHSYLKEILISEGLNAVIGHLWLVLTRQQTALGVQRVESKSNWADGPTRQSLDRWTSSALYSQPRMARSCQECVAVEN